MSAPWEKFKKDAGPWSRFEKEASSGEVPVEPGVEEGGVRPYILSYLLGIPEGATAGYASRIYPEDKKSKNEKNPISRGAGYATGALLPAGLAVKGVSTLGKLAGLSSLASGGVRATGASGALEGLISDPGDGKGFDLGERLKRAAVGGGAGASLAAILKPLEAAARQSKIFEKAYRPGSKETLAEESQKEIKKALSSLIEKQVTPRKSALRRILPGKEVDFNPDLLRNTSRQAATGAPRKKGGLDRLADLLERKAAAKQPSSMKEVMGAYARPSSPTVKLSAPRAQRLKEYFDLRSDYANRGLLGEDALAKDEGANQIANILRRKISDLSPDVAKLNEPMSEALGVKSAVTRASRQNPVEFLRSQPFSSRGSLVSKLDQLAGSNLRGRGTDIAGAAKLQTAYDGPVTTMRDLFRDTKRITGKGIDMGQLAASKTADLLKIPKVVRDAIGTSKKDAATLKILDAISEEE